MFRRLSRFWRYIQYLTKAQKVWRWPLQSDVLIFDACGKEILLEYLQPWNPEVLHVRNELISVPILLASIFRNGKRSDAYIDCFIEKVRPKLVITFIDNARMFYKISQRHSKVKTMFIQNGTRSFLFEGEQPECVYGKVDYMMTFGREIGREYSKYIQGDTIPIGSLKNNHYPISHSNAAGTIAFVSQYRNKASLLIGGELVTHEQIYQADKIVLEFLAIYARKNGKKISIIPTYELENPLLIKEKEFYNNILGGLANFSESRECGGSYYNTDAAEVVVGVLSTLLSESIARGNKTAIFSIRGQLLNAIDHRYGWPGEYADDGPFWTNNPNIESFERIMDHLFEISDEQWHADLAKHSFDKLMAYDPGNATLKSTLTKELGPASSL
jgi:surface carbohydrate biosynthesis protein